MPRIYLCSSCPNLEYEVSEELQNVPIACSKCGRALEPKFGIPSIIFPGTTRSRGMQ